MGSYFWYRWGMPGRFACVERFRKTTLPGLTLFRDVLMEVISVSHFPPESNYPRSTLKRPRDSDTSNTGPAICSGFDNGGIVERPIAGSNRVSAALELGGGVSSSSLWASDVFSGFNLPLQSGQLGSLPVYETFDWSSPQTQWISSTSPVSAPNIPGCYPSEYIDFSLISQSTSLTSRADPLTLFTANPPPFEYPPGVESSANIQDTHR